MRCRCATLHFRPRFLQVLLLDHCQNSGRARAVSPSKRIFMGFSWPQPLPLPEDYQYCDCCFKFCPISTKSWSIRAIFGLRQLRLYPSPRFHQTPPRSSRSESEGMRIGACECERERERHAEKVSPSFLRSYFIRLFRVAGNPPLFRLRRLLGTR